MLHWLSHVLGLDDLSGPYYGFWSGFGADLSELAVLGTLVAHVRSLNCEVHRCWRVGRSRTNGGHRVCHRHHPNGKPTLEDVHTMHRSAQ